MRAHPLCLAVGIALATLPTGATQAQTQAPTPQVQPAAALSPERLDQLLAPIALYPDPLITQILMAATYPLEVVEADRWMQDPDNAVLKGQQLATELAPQTWDPSVKSLVPFPEILHMMDDNLDWTEALGEAFLANQAAVMDAVQRLRQRAEAAGKLHSTPQQTVTTEGPAILIEPPSPEIVYVPVYDPWDSYGAWPDPGFPPYYFPDDFAPIGLGGIGWFGVAVAGPLWGWSHSDWGRHRIDIDRDRWTALNHRPPVGGGGVWQHDPAHRQGVPYGDPAIRGRFGAGAGVPNVFRGFRGYQPGVSPRSSMHRRAAGCRR